MSVRWITRTALKMIRIMMTDPFSVTAKSGRILLNGKIFKEF